MDQRHLTLINAAIIFIACLLWFSRTNCLHAIQEERTIAIQQKGSEIAVSSPPADFTITLLSTTPENEIVEREAILAALAEIDKTFTKNIDAMPYWTGKAKQLYYSEKHHASSEVNFEFWIDLKGGRAKVFREQRSPHKLAGDEGEDIYVRRMQMRKHNTMYSTGLDFLKKEATFAKLDVFDGDFGAGYDAGDFVPYYYFTVSGSYPSRYATRWADILEDSIKKEVQTSLRMFRTGNLIELSYDSGKMCACFDMSKGGTVVWTMEHDTNEWRVDQRDYARFGQAWVPRRVVSAVFYQPEVRSSRAQELKFDNAASDSVEEKDFSIHSLRLTPKARIRDARTGLSYEYDPDDATADSKSEPTQAKDTEEDSDNPNSS